MKHFFAITRAVSLLLLLALIFGTCLSFSACTKKDGNGKGTGTGPESSPTVPDGPEIVSGEFSFDVYAITLQQGVSAVITPSVDAAGLRWTSSDPSVATVNNGVVSGVKAGTADITAESDVDRALCRVTVTETKNEVPALSISSDDISLFIGKGFDLAPELTLSDRTIPASEYTLVCRSANTAVATVNEGVVTAAGKGKTTVTVSTTYGNFYYERTVAVTVLDVENNLVLTSDNVALCYGDAVAGEPNADRVTVPLDFKVYRNNVRQYSAEGVSFVSSDPTVVTVDGNGVLTARGIGRAIVTVEFLGDLYDVTVTVGTPIASVNDLNALSNAYLNAEDKTVCPVLWRADQIYVLAHDIDFHGASFYAIASTFRAQDGDVYWWRSNYQQLNNAQPYSFSGTIDGAGFAIKNMTLAPVIAQWNQFWFKGANFIGYMSGTLRNISFMNLTIGEHASDAIQDVGLIHNLGADSTLDNIYIQATVNAGQFAGNGAVLAGNWSYDNGSGNSVTVKNCIVNAEYANGWKPVDTYGAVSRRLGSFICAPNSNKKADISNCYLVSSTFTENELYGCGPYFSQIYPDIDTFARAKSLNLMRNEGFEDFMIAQIFPASGYIVRHYISTNETATASDTLYIEETMRGEVGELTTARARNIPGFIAPDTIEQKIIGENTVVNIFYRRDMLVDTLEQLPNEGAYSYQPQGFENTGKILLYNGKETPYSMGYRSIGIWITSDAHSGTAGLFFKKDGYDTHTMISIKLTDAQKKAIRSGGGLSFWYKSAGLPYFEINGEDIGAGASGWTEVTLTPAMLSSVGESGILQIKMYNTWFEGELYLDDITVFPKS